MGVEPLGVVLRTVLAVPGVEVVRGIDQRRHDGTDGEVEFPRQSLVEPHRHLHRTQVGLDVQDFPQHGLHGHRPELEAGRLADHEIHVLDAVGIAGRGHQLARLADGGGGVGLVTRALGQFVRRRGEIRERVDETAHQHRRYVPHHVHQHGAVQHQVNGAPHPGVPERLALVVHPDRLDDALVIVGAGHPRRILHGFEAHRVEQAPVVEIAGQQRRAQLGRERRQVVELDTVEIRQTLVPIIRVALHHPHLLVDAVDGPERPGAGVIRDLPQAVVVVLQRLLAHDDVPAAGERPEHEVLRARLAELELDGVGIADVDLAHGGEQRRSRAAETARRLDDALVGRLHVLGCQVGAVVEGHAFAQEEGVGLAVGGNLPTVRQVRDDRLAAVERVAADQVVVHAALRAHVGHGAGLVHVEVRRRVQHAVAQDAAALGVGLRGLELERRAVERAGRLRLAQAEGKTVRARRGRRRGSQQAAPGPGC